MAYRRYTEKMGWGSAAVLASKIGKSESYVSHIMSILELPLDLRDKIRQGRIGRSVAQELIWIKDDKTRAEIAEMAAERKITVKEVRLTKNHSRETNDPPFASDWIRSRQSEEYQSLTKGVIALRVAMIRLDSIIERTKVKSARDFLMEKRFALHGLIDETIAKRREVPNL